MEKSRKLVLILEGIALVVATVLILVDYKLKNDLVEMYRKMEGTLADGKQFFGENGYAPVRNDHLRSGALPGNDATLEASALAGASNGSHPPSTPGKPPAKRNGRNGNTQVPESDKQVGS